MRTLMICLVASTTLGACYRDYEPTEPQYSYGGYGDSNVVQGPPGGQMDPGYGYEDPNGYAADAPADGTEASENAVPTGDQTVTGTVTDSEIDTTLAPHGTWVEEAGYGRVWRPHTTVVGADFTPYETCGSWIYTEYGWTYSCDWDWGWLPFHYGQWAWFDSYWGWCPGYEWSPAWVEWRSNDRYVGWRPRSPILRDHRGRGRGGVVVRDHRRPRDRDWRFLDRNHLGRTNIRQHTFHRADAVRDTVAGRPPIASSPRVTSVRAVMRNRPNVIRDHRPRGPVSTGPTTRDQRGPYNTPRGGYQGEPSRPRGGGAYQPRPRDGSHSDPGGPRPRGPSSDTYQPPRGPYNTPQGGYQPPRPRGPYNTPQGGYQGESPRPSGGYQPPARPSGGYQPPARPSGGYQPPARPSGGYQPPARPSGGYQPSRPSGGYQPPARPSGGYQPSRPSGGYQPPARPSGGYQPSRPSGGYQPPARPSGGYQPSRPSGGYQPPARPSGGYQPSRDSRPSRSYDPPARSNPSPRSSGSSYSPPSRSSGSSYSPPSRSSGSSYSPPSRSSGSSSSPSRSSGGGGRRGR
jgi:hypothetical protein